MLQVFQKIQQRLSRGLSKHSAHQLEQRLAKQYAEYLHTVNTTAGVFRDTIAAEDYDPLAPRYASSEAVHMRKHQPRAGEHQPAASTVLHALPTW